MTRNIGVGCAHIFRKYLARVTFLDCFNTILKIIGQKYLACKIFWVVSNPDNDHHMLHYGNHSKPTLLPHE
jgi:hypothetical protein